MVRYFKEQKDLLKKHELEKILNSLRIQEEKRGRFCGNKVTQEHMKRRKTHVNDYFGYHFSGMNQDVEEEKVFLYFLHCFTDDLEEKP